MRSLTLLFIATVLQCVFCMPGEDVTEKGLIRPTISEMSIKSTIRNRFATTLVTSKVSNLANKAQETTFFVIIPESAFISKFIMEIGGKNYSAYVQDKKAAQKTYTTAVSGGQSAAHVSVSARDSNKFSVSVNVEPRSVAIFYLTYEELLERQNGYYELKINIHPKQLVKILNVIVDIEELRPLTMIQVLPISSGNEIGKESNQLDSRATIEKPQVTNAIIKFNPTVEKQKEIAQGLGTDENKGMAGQLIVRYDIERDPSGGEVLINNGYFVHFFAPSELMPLTKHVVFVMDTSGSMYGRRISQLKDAMDTILGELNPNDYFNLVEFNSYVNVWNLDAPSESTMFPNESDGWYSENNIYDLTSVSFPPAYPVTSNTILKSKSAVKKMEANGGTNIYEGLRVGLHLIKLRQKRTGDKTTQPLVIFLTDGEPSVGKTNTQAIMTSIAEQNDMKVPIMSLSFGNGADRTFLEKISLMNYGFARHIYEDADANLQLVNFYKLISSPLLNNVKFTYTKDATSLTKFEVPIMFKGSEIVIAGKIPITNNFTDIPTIIGCGPIGPIIFRPKIRKVNIGQMERLWAYLSVNKFLDAKKVDPANATTYDQKALELALKYSFVTEVSSLVVVKPNSVSAIDTVAADQSAGESGGGSITIGSFSGNGSGGGGGGGGGISSIGGSSSSKLAIGGPINSIADVADVAVAEENIDETEDTVPATTTTYILPTSLATKLPWLQAKINPDGTLAFLKSHLTLGINGTSPLNMACTMPNSAGGNCKLIEHCAKLYPALTGPQDYKDYLCLIENKYAGVCCPIK